MKAATLQRLRRSVNIPEWGVAAQQLTFSRSHPESGKEILSIL
jgi:hypothetical protein